MNGGIGYLYSGSISWYSSFINNLPDNSSYDVEVTEGGKRLFACPQVPTYALFCQHLVQLEYC